MLMRAIFGARGLAACGGLALAFAAGFPAAHADEGKVTVFAAASMKNALDAVNKVCAAEVGEEATISYAASSALAKQIEEGAPADVFISADLDWMKYLHDKNLVKPDTEVQLLGNKIVLVAPKDSTAEAKIEKGFDLAALIGDGKLAMGEVKSVPAGKYGKAALESLDIWPSVEGKVAQAENVRAALKLVAAGEAAAGIVYATDAVAEPGVKVIGTFPADSHPPIVYPVAQTTESKDAETGAWLKCIESDKAKPIYEEQGFTVLGGSK
ncbi:molybdate transport system substrate-binding protein [Aquamicrobium terrae]|uniref:molybdate ABC transporter substrate-binding protein n=1 Tax=Mesorhizobium sp. PUT5 TaxID=3454629 RepID=UPI003FA43F00